jgi:hypothetical protein
MSRQLRIADPELVRKANTVDEVYIGKKLFVSVVFDESLAEGTLTPDEVARVNEALADTRPGLRGDEVMEYLRLRGKDLGLD